MPEHFRSSCVESPSKALSTLVTQRKMCLTLLLKENYCDQYFLGGVLGY